MAIFIACYDLKDKNNPHQDFLEAAEALGWGPWIKGSNGKLYKLPNTTLEGTFADKEAAVRAFKAIKPAAEKTLGSPITVEKWIVAKYSEATFSSDINVDG